MEKRHKEMIKARYEAVAGKPIIVLDIEDNYGYNDPELIELLKERLSRHLEIDL